MPLYNLWSGFHHRLLGCSCPSTCSKALQLYKRTVQKGTKFAHKRTAAAIEIHHVAVGCPCMTRTVHSRASALPTDADSNTPTLTQRGRVKHNLFDFWSQLLVKHCSFSDMFWSSPCLLSLPPRKAATVDSLTICLWKDPYMMIATWPMQNTVQLVWNATGKAYRFSGLRTCLSLGLNKVTSCFWRFEFHSFIKRSKAASLLAPLYIPDKKHGASNIVWWATLPNSVCMSQAKQPISAFSCKSEAMIP